MLIEAEICDKPLPRTLHPKTTKKLEMATGLLAGTRRGGVEASQRVLISLDPWFSCACIRNPKSGSSANSRMAGPVRISFLLLGSRKRRKRQRKTKDTYAWREQERRRSESKSNMKDVKREEMQEKREREESDRPSTRKLSPTFRGSAA